MSESEKRKFKTTKDKNHSLGMKNIAPFIMRVVIIGVYYFMLRSLTYVMKMKPIKNDSIQHTEPEGVSTNNSNVRTVLHIHMKKNSDLHSISNGKQEKKIFDSLSDLTGGLAKNSIDCPKPLVPIHDIVKNSTTFAKQAIPRILHISYKSRCLPQDLFNITKMWSEALPSYSIFFHDDVAVNKLIEEEWPEFPNLHELLKCVKSKGAMLIDIWRILVLYKYGGVYVDIDNAPASNFREHLIEPFVTGFFLSDCWTRPTQSFLALEPRHPIAYNTMTKVLKNLWNLESIGKPKVVFVTGPQVLKFGFEMFAYDNKNLFHKRDAYITGFFNKTVKKMGHQKWIDMKPGWADTVPHPYNMTSSITRKRRIELEGGVEHWQRDRHNMKRLSRTSCKAYLAQNQGT